jgi:SRSO17 transposase
VGHQWLGRYGKADNGVVTVTTVWADARLYYPVHAVPYTPARILRRGRMPRGSARSWRSARICRSGRGTRGLCSGRCADSAYGDQDGFRGELADAGLPFVMALKPRRGTWA